MPTIRYLDAHEVVLAEAISRGDIPSDGYRVLAKSEYFSRPAGMCCHPQGWPCFKSCVKNGESFIDVDGSVEGGSDVS